MLSIIICSVNPDNLKRLKTNIETTTHLPHEIISYQNDERKGLCEVYNFCAEQSQYNYLCFVHDDVLFHTQGWDEKLLEHLQDKETGIIGVMGGRYKSAFGVSWNDGPVETHRYNALNGANGGNHLFYNPPGTNKDEVVCLDGALLCTTKESWQQFRFDQQTFHGFHYYDLDVCLQSHFGGKKNYVIYDVLIEHFSAGKMNAMFLAEYLLFSSKWKASLPLSIESLSRKQISDFEGYALTESMLLMKKNSFPLKHCRRLLSEYLSRYKNIYQLLRFLYFYLRPINKTKQVDHYKR